MNKQTDLKNETECSVWIPFSTQTNSCSTCTDSIPYKEKIHDKNIIQSINWLLHPVHHNFETCQTSDSANTMDTTSCSISKDEELAICEFFPATLGHVISDIPSLQANSVCCSHKKCFPVLLSPHCNYFAIDSNIQLNREIEDSSKEQNSNFNFDRSSSEKWRLQIEEQDSTSNNKLQTYNSNDLSKLSNDKFSFTSSNISGKLMSNFPFLVSGRDDLEKFSHCDTRSPSQHKVLSEKMRTPTLATCLNNDKCELPSMSPFSYHFVKLKLCTLLQKEELLLHHRRFLELERLRGPYQKWYEINDERFHDEARRYAASELHGNYLSLHHMRTEIFNSLLFQPLPTSTCSSSSVFSLTDPSST